MEFSLQCLTKYRKNRCYSVLCILLSLEIAGASLDSILKHESLERWSSFKQKIWEREGRKRRLELCQTASNLVCSSIVIFNKMSILATMCFPFTPRYNLSVVGNEYEIKTSLKAIMQQTINQSKIFFGFWHPRKWKGFFFPLSHFIIVLQLQLPYWNVLRQASIYTTCYASSPSLDRSGKPYNVHPYKPHVMMHFTCQRLYAHTMFFSFFFFPPRSLLKVNP